jgi:hypothetical protein
MNIKELYERDKEYFNKLVKSYLNEGLSYKDAYESACYSCEGESYDIIKDKNASVDYLITTIKEEYKDIQREKGLYEEVYPFVNMSVYNNKNKLIKKYKHTYEGYMNFLIGLKLQKIKQVKCLYIMYKTEYSGCTTERWYEIYL